jgi:hypothetical protein
VSQFYCYLPYLVVWETIRVTPPLTPDRWRIDRDMWGWQSRRPHDPHLFPLLFRVFWSSRDSLVSRLAPPPVPAPSTCALHSPLGPPQKLTLTMSTIEVAGSSSTNARANDQGLFQCGSCKRHYNRLDHLARHVRSRKDRTADVTWHGRESLTSLLLARYQL